MYFSDKMDFSSFKAMVRNSLPLIVAVGGYLITSLTPYASSSLLVSVVILALDEVVYIAKQDEQGSVGTVGNDALTYQVGNNTVTFTPNRPIGTSEMVGTQTFVVGKQIVTAFTIPDGDTVPFGAVYIGNGEFELNGNFYG